VLTEQTAQMGGLSYSEREDHHGTLHHARSFHARVYQGGLAKPEDRHAAISRLCEQAGGKLVSLYVTLGQYDFLVVSEMPDAKAASMLAFVASEGGGIEGSVTTQAFTTAEARDMFEAAGKIASDSGRWALRNACRIQFGEGGRTRRGVRRPPQWRTVNPH
jgi:uncharacterized protein with GYD domain